MKKSIKGLLLATSLMALVPLPSMAGVFISVSFGPPELPVYEQPACPGEGYLWTPGYWAFADDAYYWVPGTWVLAPTPGLLWTPGYWAFEDAAYFWHPGYWGPQVGFYGGINYGYGYSGAGYQGGYWDHNVFNYNRTVNNINVTNITNNYYAPVINNNPGSHVAYNGGPGGLHARPSPQEQLAMREPHREWTHGQLENEQAARHDPLQRVSFNRGRPAVFATPTPAALHGPGAVVQARHENAPVMSQHPAPHAPVVAYDAHGRGQIERTSVTPPPKPAQQRAPQYRYTQDAPQGGRPPQYRYTPEAPPSARPQPPAVQRSAMNEGGRPRQPQIQRPDVNTARQAPQENRQEAPHYSYRQEAPQARYPQTMAQWHPQPGNPRMNAPAQGAYQPAAQPPHERPAPPQPRYGDGRPPQGQPPQQGHPSGQNPAYSRREQT